MSMVHDFLHHCSAFSTFIGSWCFILYILHLLLYLSQQVWNVPGPLFNVYAVGDFDNIFNGII